MWRGFQRCGLFLKTRLKTREKELLSKRGEIAGIMGITRTQKSEKVSVEETGNLYTYTRNPLTFKKRLLCLTQVLFVLLPFCFRSDVVLLLFFSSFFQFCICSPFVPTLFLYRYLTPFCRPLPSSATFCCLLLPSATFCCLLLPNPVLPFCAVC